MKIVTNPGANLPPDLVEKYGMSLTPIYMSVDGVRHENRTLDALRVEELLRTAKVRPFPLGTSAAEYVTLFRDLTADGSELLVTTASRKIIGTYDSGLAAARTLGLMSTSRAIHISMVDTGGADVASGLVTIFCAASAKAGRSREAIAEAAAEVARRMMCAFVPQTLDYLVAGGRATFLKAMAANLLQKVPVISLVDGDLKSTGMLSKTENHASAMADSVVAKLGAKRSVWIAVAHGNAPERGRELFQALHERLDVRFGFERELTPGYYLNTGPGTLCMAVIPTDSFPWPLDVR